jgi:CRISPR-associated protein Csx10
MKAITFLLKTEQPLLATSFQGDPNSDVSYPYIPGSMIRGALISRYLKLPGKSGVDIVADEISRRLFFDGTTRYLNAYPNSQDDLRSLPTLLSWRKEKGREFKDIKDKIDVYDWSVFKDNDDLQSPKSVNEPFWVEDGNNVRLYSVDRRINIHNLRDRRKGRSASDKLDPTTLQIIEERDGEIFRYDAIDAGQTFQGVILYDEADENNIQDLLNISDIWLGGSRSAGYGHVKISDVKINNSWSEINTSPEKRNSDNILKVTLLSDLIIRDDCGQYAAIPPTQLLAEFLGKQSEELEKSLNQYKTYMDSVFLGGFNRKWGLPLPQILGVKAGSVFVYENVAFTAKQICQLETIGMGERKAEGFGRVAVNWRVENSQFTARKPETKTYTKRNQPPLKESHDLARQMAERILRQKLEELLLDRVEEFRLNPNRMTNSQLSRLIFIARQSLDINCRQPLDLLLDNLPSNARTKYDRTKVSGQSLNQKIKDWLDHPQSWIDGHLEPVAIANEPATLTDELALEYTLRLIIAIAKNATKEKPDE